ncbi:MAG: sulfatase-like hydrolase/transferase [Planctomycetes bacterium]|nr:sulfatase-like hydrolase/transferase [Planctomycetota bacterium]
MAKRPNILFLMTDQQRHDAMGCVNPVIQTPTLDAIAARGVRFSQCVCNVPICVPSRYSMMCGLYGFQVGVRHNTQMYTRDEDLPVPVLAQRLLEAGYQTAGFGKTHWYIGSGIMPGVEVKGSRRGFEVRSIQSKREPNNDEVGSLYMADDEPEWFERVREESGKSGPGGEAIEGYIGETSGIPAEHHFEGWLTRQALEFLDNGRDATRPLFLYLSLDYPHAGLHVPPGFEGLYDINAFPDSPPPEPMPGGHRHRESGDQWGYFEDRWPRMTPEQRRMSRLRYAAICTYVDSCFGQVIDRLEAMGELDNTFIIFTADHGDMLGDRGRVSKYCLYEGSVRVPMLVAGPGVDRHGAVDDRPVELVDVMPTLLDVAGCGIPEFLPGFSLLSDFSRRGAFAELHGRGYEEYQRAPAVMWRTGDWKLILHMPGRLWEACLGSEELSGELYHLADDPLELNNLYASGEHAEVRERMTAEALMHVMCSLGKYPYATARTRIRVTGQETKPDRGKWE